jgi:hypothetical protein
MELVEITSQLLDSGILGIVTLVLGWAYWQEKSGRKADNDFWIEKSDKRNEELLKFFNELKEVIERNGGK